MINSRHGQLSLLFLKTADMAMLLIALGTSIVINYAPIDKMSVSAYSLNFLSTRVKLGNALLCGLLLLVWHASFKVYGLYLSVRLGSLVELLSRVFKAIGVSSLLLFAVANVGGWDTLNVRTTLSFLVLALVLVGGYRSFVVVFSRRMRMRGVNSKVLLVLGGGKRGEKFIRTVNQRPELGYRIIGYLDSDPPYAGRALCGVPYLGGFDDLDVLLEEDVIDEAVIALPIKSQYNRIKFAISRLEEQGLITHVISDFFPHHLARIKPQEFQGLPILSLQSAPAFHWRTELKRYMDIAGSALLLFLCLPLFGLVALLIRLDSKGPVFFLQERMGYNKRRFRLIKFRSMVSDAEALQDAVEDQNEKSGPIFKIRNDPRITRVGRFLRRSSLDELPQLINVLIGDMSLVGPRPLSIRDASRVEESWQKRRFSVKPGMTCLWQISGRSNLSFDEWIELDLKYIDSWSLNLDWWILLKTIPAVLTARGAA